MRIKIFCDIAELNQIKKFNKKKIVKGFTTNPSLMRNAGAKDYVNYSKKILRVCSKKPISFEVFADNYKDMKIQAIKINNLGKNVYVKIPVVNSKGIFSGKIIKELSEKKIKLNITAVYTANQVKKILELSSNESNYDKGEFKHFMAKEIEEQPVTIKTGIKEYLDSVNNEINIFNFPWKINEIKSITLIGCGTAYHSCLMAKYWFEELTTLDVNIDIASEFRYRKNRFKEDSLYIFVSKGFFLFFSVLYLLYIFLRFFGLL